MSECNHSWRAIPGSNDYECDSCGDRKLDSGALVSEWTDAHCARSEQIKLTPQEWNGSAKFCRGVGMNATQLRQTAAEMRRRYDGRGTHLAVAYLLEGEASEMDAGVKAAASSLAVGLASPYLPVEER